MTRAFSNAVPAIFRAGALVCVVLLFSGLCLAQKVVTARATIPFNCWAEGHEFQAGDYVFDNEVPQLHKPSGHDSSDAHLKGGVAATRHF